MLIGKSDSLISAKMKSEFKNTLDFRSGDTIIIGNTGNIKIERAGRQVFIKNDDQEQSEIWPSGITADGGVMMIARLISLVSGYKLEAIEVHSKQVKFEVVNKIV